MTYLPYPAFVLIEEAHNFAPASADLVSSQILKTDPLRGAQVRRGRGPDQPAARQAGRRRALAVHDPVHPAHRQPGGPGARGRERRERGARPAPASCRRSPRARPSSPARRSTRRCCAGCAGASPSMARRTWTLPHAGWSGSHPTRPVATNATRRCPPTRARAAGASCSRHRP